MTQSIATLIPYGKKNAISRAMLVSKADKEGLLKAHKSKDREMRRLISEARFSGKPILSADDGSGYYRPTKEEIAELRNYIIRESKRAKAILGSLKSAANLLEDYEHERFENLGIEEKSDEG